MLTHISITMCQWSVWGFLLLSYYIATAASDCVCMCHPPSGGCLHDSPTDAAMSAALKLLCCWQESIRRQRSFFYATQSPCCISAPDCRYCRAISRAQLVFRSLRAPWTGRVHWPRCPVVTPPINHHWLTAPALRKREPPLSPFQDDGWQRSAGP